MPTFTPFFPENCGFIVRNRLQTKCINKWIVQNAYKQNASYHIHPNVRIAAQYNSTTFDSLINNKAIEIDFFCSLSNNIYDIPFSRKLDAKFIGRFSRLSWPQVCKIAKQKRLLCLY